MKKEIVLSGTRPTGKAHLGTYFGAISNFVKLQDTHECFFFIADYHSLTTHPDAELLQKLTRETIATYIACGLDPDKATLYVQSDLPQIPELYLILNMFAYKGELEKTTTFKDKVRKPGQTVNAGLLTYPVLMAADILIHRADKVPVGKDQEQHLEMTRNFANRFNNVYKKEVFPEPEAFNYGNALVKIPGLDGSGKMGKSEGEGNAVFLLDEEKVNSKKIMRAKTDSGPTEMNQEKPLEIQNLFYLMSTVSDASTVEKFESDYNNCAIRYGDMKKQLAADVEAFVAPIRSKAQELIADEAYLNKVMKQGAEKARASADATMKEVKSAIGLSYY